MIGLIPPHSIEIEEAILGALMLEKNAIDKINTKPEHFYKDSHQKIFTAIQKLAFKSEPIDLMTVSEFLKKETTLEDIGGYHFLALLTNKVASASHIEYHSLILYDKFIKRELIRISSEVQKQAFDDSIDTFEVFDKFYSQMDSINVEVSENDEQLTWIELMKKTLKEAERRQTLYQENKTIGIPTPLHKLTKWTCGWQPKQLIVIAGRPGMGKSAWGIDCLIKASQAGYKSAFFSLEMSNVSIANRIIIGTSGISADDFRSGNIQNYDWMKLNNSLGKMQEYNILIDDKPKSINRIRTKVKSLHRKGLCDLVVIDYIQLSWDDTTKNQSIREQEVAMVSRKLKLMAQELDIPVIALSQLNRAVENRANKIPQLSDIRESGAIEQDADVIIFVHRPEKYGITVDEDGKPLDGRCNCILEKQREGNIGTIYYKHNDSVTAIYDWDENNYLNTYNPDRTIEHNLGF